MKRHDPELSGETLAERYRLITPVGRGAMGAVWRARDLAGRRDVAVKLIDGRRDGTNRAARFLREGRAMARLHSPHVVGILDHGRCLHPTEEGEIAFLVMELLEGESLARRLDRADRLDATTTLRIINHVGRGISLAHARGIVHRDLKPANIFLSGPPPITAKVLDFGLAKPWAPLPADAALHTAVGKPLGTPYYMSPEQCRGLPNVDHRSDLWALGVITYECLCGRKPFDARTIPELFERIAGANPAPPSTQSSVPDDLDQWMRRALAPDVQRRFQSASEMVRELRDVLGVEDASIPPPRPSVDGALHTRVLVAHGPERTLRRLPGGATRLVGRDHLITQIADAVASHSRVITLHGDRGSGRSALAEVFAEDQRGNLPGGIWRVPLAHCESARQMLLAFATVLEATAAFEEAGLATCLASFGPAIVLVTDADRVREPLNRLIARVLRDAPQVIVIVTASHPLQAPTERALPVVPLTAAETARLLANRVDQLGDRTTPSERDDLSTSMLAAAEATAGNALVTRLLADAWARGAHEPTATRIAQAEGRGDGKRLAQLEAVIDTLPDDERGALARCGSRRAFFGAESVEALGVTRADLTKLLRRGWVVETSRPTQPFGLHPLVRRACSRRLTAGRDLATDRSTARAAARELLTRHAKLISEHASRARLLELREAGDARMRRRYVDLYADAEAAAQRMRAGGQDSLALRCELVAAMAEHLLGAPAAAANRLGTVEVVAGDLGTWLDAQLLRGRALLDGGELNRASDVTESAITIADQQGDQEASTLLRLLAAEVALADGRLERTRHTALDMLRRATEDERRGPLATALTLLGRLDLQLGDPTAARPRLRQALELQLARGARTMVAQLFPLLAEASQLEGDLRGAQRQLTRALEEQRLLGDRTAEAEVLTRLGQLAFDAGRVDEALAWLDEGLQAARERGARDLEARALTAAALAHERGGRPSRSEAQKARAEELWRSLDDEG